jgi:starch-binding outer membrane protein SusE/F
MRKLLFISIAFLATIFVACNKDDNIITLEGGTPPVLTASRTGTIPLLFVEQGQEALVLSWTHPKYRFTTGVSSQNVTYQIEFDTTGANFTNPKKKVISVSGDLSKSFTQGDLNDILLNGLELKAGMPHNIEVRVKSFMANNSAMLVSNVIKFIMNPYAIPPKVTPPASNKLFIVGGATPGGWANPVPVPSQEFTKVSDTQYEITIPLTSGQSYLLLPVNGDWGTKYGALGSNNSNNPLADDFKTGGGDLLAPTISGTYKIQVNFQTGKYQLTKL